MSIFQQLVCKPNLPGPRFPVLTNISTSELSLSLLQLTYNTRIGWQLVGICCGKVHLTNEIIYCLRRRTISSGSKPRNSSIRRLSQRRHTSSRRLVFVVCQCSSARLGITLRRTAAGILCLRQLPYWGLAKLSVIYLEAGPRRGVSGTPELPSIKSRKCRRQLLRRSEVWNLTSSLDPTTLTHLRIS